MHRWIPGLALAVGLAAFAAEPVPLRNADFEDGAAARGVPVGWTLYGGGGEALAVDLIPSPAGDGQALRLRDSDPQREIGISQQFAAMAGQPYRVGLLSALPTGASSQGAHLQLRFLPSDRFVQAALNPGPDGAFRETVVYGTAPAGTTAGVIYIYTHREPTPTVVIDRLRVEAGVPRPAAPVLEETRSMPEPRPPVYAALKPLHLETPLVAAGQPGAIVVVPADGRHQAAAELIVAAVAQRTGVTLRIVADADPAAALPLSSPAIVLGNRSTNRTMSGLYDRYYALIDLKYPGPGGYVVRSLHNPFGDGRNVILVGGSDADGVRLAAERFATRVQEAPRQADGGLALGWLADIRLGDGMAVPETVAEARLWEESRTYGSSGYFGWNVISKAMALYYMTGDERFAREFLRLGFPDAAAIKELEELDGERIENKHEPLAGPYHYSAHMMVLFWDLIEESPIFTDEIRLRVTNAFSAQLRHRAAEHVYGTTTPPAYVGDRHRDWSATSLYVLARYFQKDYPDPVWQAGLDSCRTYFAALLNSPWLAGRNDHLFWYTSYYDPIVDYVILSSDRTALEEGHLAEALRTQDVLFTGNEDDWGLRASSLSFLQRTAYLTGDGKWLFYRQRTGIDTSGLRLGQSFWTDEPAPRAPEELRGVWTVQPMPRPFWADRRSGLPLEESFLWGSYRTRLDGQGDYVLVKGHNGGGRNPHHTFALLEFRLAGHTLLKGYGTQVQTSADGMVEPVVGMDAALKRADVLGRSACVVGEVPRLPFCTWRRALLLRPETFAVIVDRFDYRTDSANLARLTTWETLGGTWSAERGAVLLRGSTDTASPPGWTLFPALRSPCTSRPANADAARSLIDLDAIGIRMVKATRPGDYIEQSFSLERPFEGQVHADLMHYSDRGVVRLLLDGQPVVAECDHFAATAVKARIPLGTHRLAAGTHTLRVEALRCREGQDRCYIGLAGVALQAAGAADPGAAGACAICPSDPGTVRGAGLVTSEWTGPVRNGSRQTCFTLFAATPDLATRPLSCQRLGEEAAFLRTPSPALVVAGRHDGIVGELVLLDGDGLSARAFTALSFGGITVAVDRPADVDWDWSTGVLLVACPEPVRLRFSAPGPVQVDGEEAVAPTAGEVAVPLAPGRHTIAAARPPDAVLAGLRSSLAALGGEAASSPAAASPHTPASAEMPALAPQFTADLRAPVVALAAAGDRFFAAAAREIVAFAVDGTPGVRMRTEGDVRTLHWWPEHALLLAGCADERVIAFRSDGTVAWSFTSEMDRAVWEAAKQYWFKSAHPGIYGLDTGAFLEGGTQCFIGSACTLEILDGGGRLIKRLPVFWGPGWRFGIRPKADGSRDLLIARQPTDSHALAIVNSRALDRVGSGFDGVPAGHTNLTGWATMSRNHLVIRDLDGDGQKEVVSEINGFWNRITVWDLDGNPRHNAQIGPGRQIPYRNVRDLVVEDLDGDGKCEVVAALDSGLVSALDCTLQRRWSLRPATPANLLSVAPRAGARPALLAACDGGDVLQLTAGGAVSARGLLPGKPVAACVLARAGGDLCVLATATGQIQGYTALP